MHVCKLLRLFSFNIPSMDAGHTTTITHWLVWHLGTKALLTRFAFYRSFPRDLARPDVWRWLLLCAGQSASVWWSLRAPSKQGWRHNLPPCPGLPRKMIDRSVMDNNGGLLFRTIFGRTTTTGMVLWSIPEVVFLSRFSALFKHFSSFFAVTTMDFCFGFFFFFFFGRQRLYWETSLTLSQGVIREKLFIHVKLSRNSIKHSFDIWFKGDAGWLKLSHIYLYLFKTQSDFTGFSTKFTLQYGKKIFPPPPSSCGTDRTIVRQAMSMGGVTFKVSVYLPTAAGAGAIIFLRHQYCWVSVVKGKENDHRPPMLCLLSHHFFFAFLLSRDGGYCCCWWKWAFFPYRELEIFTSSTIGLLNRYCRVVYSVRLGP